MTCKYYIPIYTTMRDINDASSLHCSPDDGGESVPSDVDIFADEATDDVDPPDGANPIPFCNTTH